MSGIPGRFFPHKVTNPETRQQIAKRFEAGEPAKLLGEVYGCSPQTVRRYAAEWAK